MHTEVLGALSLDDLAPLPRDAIFRIASLSKPIALPWWFGWNGGTGTAWYSDPARGLTGILLTTRAMTSPEPLRHVVDFWEAAYGAIAG